MKYIRLTLAILYGGIVLIYFLDFTGGLPSQLHGLLHLQAVPALMTGGLIFGLLLLTTLLLGRIYCSVICPMGILQDVVIRVKTGWMKVAKKGKRIRYTFARPLNILRYVILGMVAVSFAAGFTLPLLLTDPYSNFGRIAVSLFRPVVVGVNNLAASVLTSMGNYSLYKVTVEHVSWLVAVTSAIVLIAVTVTAWRRGRLVCNSVCPVGALLGLFSRFSLFRITLSDGCNKCKMCAAACKSECIDTENRKVDASRCVTCFNCLGKCKQGAVSYSPSGWRLRAESTNIAPAVVSASESRALTPKQLSRRRFITGTLVTAAALGATRLFGEDHEHTSGRKRHRHGNNGGTSDCNHHENSNGHGGGEGVQGGGHDGESGECPQNGECGEAKRTHHAMPPGAISRELFADKCTACQLCISKCPTQVLQPAYLEYGLTGIMQPVMKFRTERFCNYECKACTEVCPNGALVKLSLDEKKLTRVGNVVFVRDRCVVQKHHQDCGACAEHCPTQAVHMVAFGDTGLTIPEITPDLCIGCGGCESICPETPPAIFIDGLLMQEEAAVPSKDEREEVEVTDFGF